MHIIVMSSEFSQDYDISLIHKQDRPYTREEFIAHVQACVDEVAADCPELYVKIENFWSNEANDIHVFVHDDLIKIEEENDGFGGSRSTMFKILEV